MECNSGKNVSSFRFCLDFHSPTSSLRSANLGQPKHGAFEVSLPPALAEAPNSKGMRDGTIAQAPHVFGQNPFPSQFSELSQDRFFVHW